MQRGRGQAPDGEARGVTQDAQADGHAAERVEPARPAGRPEGALRLADQPRAQVELLVANLPTVSEALAAGAVVVFEKARVRIRSLPIAGQGRFS